MAHMHHTAFMAATLLASASSIRAQMTWFVDDDAPPGGDGLAWQTAFDDLQPAMELALPGDAIWLAEGVYVPSVIDPIAGEDQPYFLMPDGVALLGGFRGDETTADQRDPETYESVISGDLLGNDLDSPITGTFDSSPEMQALYQSKLDNTGTLLFVDRTGPGTVVNGIVFEEAYTDQIGGSISPMTRNGVFVHGAIFDVVNCEFRNNVGQPGGAMYVVANSTGTVPQPSAVAILDSEFIDNVDFFGDDACNCLGASVLIRDSLALIDNIEVRFSRQLDIFARDEVGHHGVWVIGDGDAVISGSRFENCGVRKTNDIQVLNGVSAIGVGAFSPSASIAEISDCIFENNIAAPYGTVRFAGGRGTVRRSFFLNNLWVADRGSAGGAAGIAFGALGGTSPLPTFAYIAENIFVGNTAIEIDRFKGILPNDRPVLATAAQVSRIWNNTFAANPTLGDQLFLFSPDTRDAREYDNLIAGFSPVLDPLFTRTPNDGGDGWFDNAGTRSVDESANNDYGDLRLTAGSPAIDAGGTFFDLDTILDLAGNDRYVDDPGIPGAFVDLGAYEFQGVTCLPDVNQDGVVGQADFNAWILAFNDRSPLADQNRDGEVTPADYNAWILNFNNGCP